MTYLFSRKNRPGLDALASNLGATRLCRFDGESFWDRPKRSRIVPAPGSVIIPWGENLPEMEDLRVLNGREQPKNEVETYEILSSFNVRSCKNYLESVNSPDQWSQTPNYLPRKFGQPAWPYANRPDYYSELQTFAEEYVIHSFAGKSIRAGLKKVASGRALAASSDVFALSPTAYAHPTIKSSATGWVVDHTVSSTADLRAIAHKAVKVLDLKFASVTIGKTSTGALVVVGLNVGPDLTNPLTLKAYTKAILKWIDTPEVINAPIV